MPSGRVRPAVLTIFVASLLLLANAVPASGADPTPPPCKTAAEFDPANFPDFPNIDNQWNPLAPGMQFVLAGEATGGKGLLPHRVVSTVTDLIKVVDGVRAVVILETDFNQGVLVKSELAFQAQDNAGNIWNLGEFPAAFDDKGNFEQAPDTWISGLSDAEPGNLMLGNPQLGTPEYLQGWSPDIDFLTCAKVYKMQQKTCVPVDCYDNVLITEEWSPLEQGSGHQRKYYAPGVGNVRVDAVGDPSDQTLVLAEVSQLSPEDLEKVRQEALKLEKIAYAVSAVYSQTSPSVPTTEPTKPESPQPTQKEPKPNPNPPPGVKHDIPLPLPDESNSDYSNRVNWELKVKENCTDAGYAEDCLVLTYDFKMLEDGELTSMSDDPGPNFADNDIDCDVTDVDPPTGNSKKIAPNTKITVYVVCVPDP
jgi:hypothetical protein